MFIRIIIFQLFILALLSQSVFAGAIDCNGGRYENNNNGTVSDCRTGLIWLKDATCLGYTSGEITNTYGYLTWAEAQTFVAGLQNGICGLTDGSAAGDWRLPTKTEFMAMIQSAINQKFGSDSAPVLTDETGTNQWTAGHPFTNVWPSQYWTDTTDLSNADLAWDVRLYKNAIPASVSKTIQRYMWPVRAGNGGLYKSVLIQ